MALRASASAAPALRPAALRGAPAEVKAALILPGDINIEVAKPDVEGNSGIGLPADAGGSALNA